MIVNNSSKINKTKESLTSDSQQFRTTIRKHFDGERQQVVQRSVAFVADTLKELL
jgi:hypothetical protein